MKKLFLIAAILAFAWQFASADGDGNNRLLWEQNFSGYVHDCAFMPDEDYIINTCDTRLQVRRTADQSLVKDTVFSEGVLYSIDVSQDGQYVAVGGGSILMLLDINTFEVIHDYHKSTNCISLSPDGKRLAFVGSKAYVLDVDSGNVIFEFGEDSLYGPMEYVKFTPDGKYLVCFYAGGGASETPNYNIYVFNADSLDLYHVFENEFEFDELSITVDSNLICSSYYNGLKFWNISTKEATYTEMNFGIPCEIFYFLNDKNTMYCYSYGFQKSFFYDFSQKIVIKQFDFAPPLRTNHTFNSDQTLLLGDRLCLTQIDLSVVSVHEQIKKTEDIIIPNPTTGQVLLKVELPYNEIASIDLYDNAGGLVANIKNEIYYVGENEFSYDASALPQGAYFIKIKQKDFEKTLKLIKEN